MKTNFNGDGLDIRSLACSSSVESSITFGVEDVVDASEGIVVATPNIGSSELVSFIVVGDSSLS